MKLLIRLFLIKNIHHVFFIDRTITDSEEYGNIFGFISASKLKHKDRDRIDAECQKYYSFKSEKYKAEAAW